MIQTWAVKLLAGLLVLAGVWAHGYRHGQAREQRKTAAAVQEAESNARAITARRIQTIQEAQDAEYIARTAAQRDAAAARTAADRLRQQAADFAASGLPADPAAAASCAPTEDRARVLANVLGRAAERADQLAEQADGARIAGQLCVSAYDALTPR